MATNKQFKDKDGNDITDTNAVHKTGDESVAGVKTFTDSIKSERSSGGTFIRKFTTNYHIADVPTSEMTQELIHVFDADGVMFAKISFAVNTNGKRKLYVKMLNSDNTTEKSVVLAESD